MNILGLSYGFHNSAAVLLQDGELIAATEEERFSRQKNDSRYPVNAIKYCLEVGKINKYNLDYVAFYEKPLLKFSRSFDVLVNNFPKSLGLAGSVIKSAIKNQFFLRNFLVKKLSIHPEKIKFIPHHTSHAASSFYSSGLDEASILTIDGVGEWATAQISSGQSIGSKNAIINLKQLNFPHSIGMLYSTFTQFLGFSVNEGEYKVMGLAAYGKPIYLDKINKLIHVFNDGSFKLDMSYFNFLVSRKVTYSKKFIKLFGPANQQTDGHINHYYIDIAASIQAKLEEILLLMANHAFEINNSVPNLCLAGGIALNGVANAKLVVTSNFKKIFIQPAAGDAGGALGAALFVEHEICKQPRKFIMKHVYWGAEFSDDQIENVLNRNSLPYRKVEDYDELSSLIASHIKDGKIIGWFQGRAEWGPRALGSRSILADPRNAEIKDIINSKIKFRESFRPFAPAILREKVDEYFDTDSNSIGLMSPYMTSVEKFRKNKDTVVEGVNHCGTGRLQSVDKNVNYKFYTLIEKFYELTGVPILLNTSFNLKDEPIVNTPEDAISTFTRCGIDVLVLGSFVLLKSEIAVEHLEVRDSKTWKENLYQYAPQLREYHKLKVYPEPYLAFISEKSFRSTVVNTDSNGFRYCYDKHGLLTTENYTSREEYGLFLGGSSAFGVGASNDSKTIPALLNKKMNLSLINLGIRSGNSTQELIASLPFIQSAQQVFCYTGNNTLLAWFQTIGSYELFSPLFREEVLSDISSISLSSYHKFFNKRKNELDDMLSNKCWGTNRAIQDSEESIVRKAARTQIRDILLLKRLTPISSNFTVIIQPLALCAKHNFSEEEDYLFNLLFKNKKGSYKLNKIKMGQYWGDYIKMVVQFCERESIKVIDTNKFEYPGWCFLDPVHMTDLGYRTIVNLLMRELV